MYFLSLCGKNIILCVLNERGKKRWREGRRRRGRGNAIGKERRDKRKESREREGEAREGKGDKGVMRDKRRKERREK